MKRFAFLCAVLLGAALFCSCGTKDTPTKADTTTVTSDAQDGSVLSDMLLKICAEVPGSEVDLTLEELDVPAVKLTEEYKIVCANRQSDTQFSLARSLQASIREKTGMTLTVANPSSENPYEIIIGYSVDRPASVAAYDGIERGDGILYIGDGKIVLGGYSNERLSQILRLFVDFSLEKDGENYSVKGYRIVKDKNGLMQLESDLSEYCLVYGKSAADYGLDTVAGWRVQIQKMTGKSVSAKSDASTVDTEHELILGFTDRGTPESAKAFLPGGERELKPYEWVFIADENNLYVLGQPFAVYLASFYLSELYDNEFAPGEISEAALGQPMSIINTKDKADYADGADLRIMSYNILHESWSNVESTVPVRGRAERFASVLTYYMPDVAGIQEVSSSWHKEIQKLLVNTGFYKKECAKTGTNKSNMTTFLYNPQTVKPVENYVLDIDYGSDIRVLSVAVFEKLSDGKRFVVTNTHPATASSDNYTEHIRKLSEMLTEVIAKYPELPVFMTGDFNSKETSTGYPILTALPILDAKYNTKELVRNYNSFLKPRWGGEVSPGDTGSFDHIFVTNKSEVLRFNTVIDNSVEKISDHLPIYADVKFK